MSLSESTKESAIVVSGIVLVLCSIIWSMALYSYRGQDLERQAMQAGLVQKLEDHAVLWVKP